MAKYGCYALVVMCVMNALTDLFHNVRNAVYLNCEHVTWRLNLGILSLIWTVNFSKKQISFIWDSNCTFNLND